VSSERLAIEAGKIVRAAEPRRLTPRQLREDERSRCQPQHLDRSDVRVSGPAVGGHSVYFVCGLSPQDGLIERQPFCDPTQHLDNCAVDRDRGCGGQLERHIGDQLLVAVPGGCVRRPVTIAPSQT
jgi:hypothetical protein